MLDLDMGAYAAFVWPAWGISAALLAALAIRALIAARRWNAELKHLDKDAPQPRAQAARSAVAQTK